MRLSGLRRFLPSEALPRTFSKTQRESGLAESEFSLSVENESYSTKFFGNFARASMILKNSKEIFYSFWLKVRLEASVIFLFSALKFYLFLTLKRTKLSLASTDELKVTIFSHRRKF